MDNNTGEQRPKRDYAELLPYQFKKGQSGNPSGRPKGPSLKERAKVMLAHMSEEEAQDYLNGIDKRTIWEMAEGKAKQDNETKITGDLNIKIVKYGDNSAV